jgi:asparagine synthase (glutamine-hydrolysing)
MCGITGKLHFDSARPVDETLIRRMNSVLTHRGPDDEGVWTDGPIGLGQCRLAIIDLSPTGHQPMSNEACAEQGRSNGTVWITYNGEIYNHMALRADLERRGHRYRSTSDTETILHLYEEHGRNCVKYLRGMFAFALWDTRARRLLLARDRFGKKPLLYAETAEGLTFASEIKALLQDPAVSRDVDDLALHHYLTYGYVPAPQTAFRAIRKLPPASTLLWEDGHISVERYWTLSYMPKLQLTEDEAAEQLLALLRQATQMRLMSEVPLGAFLSGGIDSSAVVALMAEATSEPVKTFSIGFDDQSFNELHYARQVAEHYATDHHEFTVTPDALGVLPELVWAYGEPYADSSALPTYYVARETRHTVTVALNGDGGDEAFAGYERYLATRLAARYERVPRWLREGIVAPLARRLPESTSRTDLFRRLKRFVLAMGDSPERRYARWIILLDNPDKEQLYTPEFRARMAGVDSLALLEAAYAAADSPDFVERTQFVDVHTYLPDDLLVKVDVAAMIHSLEGRSPFLDHELAEFAARLPVDYKLCGRTSKVILKRALRGYLPESILRRGKQGFGIPVGRWFRHELRPVAYSVLLDPRTLQRGILDGNAVRALLDEHVAGQVNHGYRIWELLFLELWFRAYIDRPRAELTGPAEGFR